MIKLKAAIFILLAVFFIASKAYCQQDPQDQDSKTIAGIVTFVDVAGGIISVQTDQGTLVFNITVESDLLRFAHHMASIDIEKGDPVMVQYESLIPGKNNIIKLVEKRFR